MFDEQGMYYRHFPFIFLEISNSVYGEVTFCRLRIYNLYLDLQEIEQEKSKNP